MIPEDETDDSPCDMNIEVDFFPSKIPDKKDCETLPEKSTQQPTTLTTSELDAFSRTLPSAIQKGPTIQTVSTIRMSPSLEKSFFAMY
jgi:hypothetical protein